VIPTLILFGLVFGRWWLATLIVSAIGWPVLLIATDVESGIAFVIGAGTLAVANAGVGILIHRALWLLVRGVTSAGRRFRDRARTAS
jgi:hypothetical protein